MTIEESDFQTKQLISFLDSIKNELKTINFTLKDIVYEISNLKN